MERDGKNVISRKDAKSAKMMRYFTGAPCKRGHIASRLVSTSACADCSFEKYTSEEELQKKRVHYYENIEIMRKRNSSNYWKHQEARKEYASIRYPSVKDEQKEYNAEYYAKNRELVLSQNAKWRAANPDYAHAQNARYYLENIDKFRAYGRNYKARKKKAEGEHTPADISRIRVHQKDRCAYCKIRLNMKGHVDHIIPLSTGGSNWPNNLQLLCVSCNLSKRAKHPAVFAREIGFLI